MKVCELENTFEKILLINVNVCECLLTWTYLDNKFVIFCEHLKKVYEYMWMFANLRYIWKKFMNVCECLVTWKYIWKMFMNICECLLTLKYVNVSQVSFISRLAAAEYPRDSRIKGIFPIYNVLRKWNNFLS